METEDRLPRERLGLAEWTCGLALLFGSLIGPWLTLAFPAAVVFAALDRRGVARAVAVAAALPSGLLGLAAPGGPALLAMTAGAVAGSLAWVATGRRAALAPLAWPTLGGAAAGLGAAWLAAPGAPRAWEAMLRRGVVEGGAAAVEGYRGLGMDPATLTALESLIGVVAEWTVRLWPSFAALSLWLGAWLAWRLFARWGRPGPGLAPRLARVDFADFAVGVPAAWLLIAGLAGLWLPTVERAAANAGVVGATLFALDGLAVAWWWLDRRGAGIVIRLVGLTVLFAFALPILTAALILLGLADVWLQFRDRPPAAPRSVS